MSDVKAKAMVLEVLGNSVIPKINFKLTGVSVSHASYLSVAKAIETGKITVLYDRPATASSRLNAAYVNALKLPTGAELYDLMVLDRFELSSNPQHKIIESMLVVHECTHAAFDIAGVKTTKLEDEAAAFVAGAMFGVLKATENGVNPNGVTVGLPIQAAAWNLAIHLSSGAKNWAWFFEYIPKLHALYTALLADANYKVGAGAMKSYDGVGKASLPARSH